MELIHVEAPVKIQLKIHTYRHVESGVAKAASAEVCESVCTHTHTDMHKVLIFSVQDFFSLHWGGNLPAYL